MKTNRVVLVGAQAQGKSTFFNQITKSNQKTSFSGDSCTRALAQGSTKFGQGFEVIDTPGLNSSVDKLTHVAGVLAALTYGLVNRIIIVAKYERNDDIYDNIDLLYRPIYRFKELITILFTHWDKCEKASVEEQQQEQQRIAKQIKTSFNIESILFFSKNDNPEIICLQIEKILLYSKNPEKIKLMESEIFKNCDLIELSFDSDQTMQDHLETIKVQFARIAKVYGKFIDNLDKEDPYFLSVLHQLTLAIKNEANEKLKEFEMKNGEQIEKMVDKNGNQLQYLHYIMLKKEIKTEVEYVIKKAQQKMRQSKYHFFNFLKRCPHKDCGQIWLKVVGCEDQTYCGNPVNCGFDGLILIEPSQNLKIVRNNEKIVYTILKEDLNQIKLEQQEQLIKHILQNKQIQKFNLDSVKMDRILKQQYGDKYLDVIIPKLLKGELNESKIIKKIIDKLEVIPFSSSYLLNSLDDQEKELDKLQEQRVRVGCGRIISWKDQPPLSSQELEGLFSTELLEYFADEEKQQKEEIDWLDKTYKAILNEEIEKQQKNIFNVDLKQNEVQAQEQ